MVNILANQSDYLELTVKPNVLRTRTHGNVFLRFCIVSSNELVVLDSLENSKQYKNAGKCFRVSRGTTGPYLLEQLVN